MTVPCPRHLTYLAVIAAIFIIPAPAYPGDLPLFASYPNIDRSLWFPSHGWSNGEHQSCEWRADALEGHNNMLQLTLSNRGGRVRPIGCPELQSKARYGFGRFEARMRTAAGSGLNTAFFTFIGPPLGVPEHDEIDFEFLGKDPTTVELNYWVNAKQQPSYVLHLGYDASKEFHDYAFEWGPQSIKWFVDGKLVHETDEGASMPHNPGKLFLSLWSGSEIEDSWMGHFTYTQPVTADVAWVKYTRLEGQK